MTTTTALDVRALDAAPVGRLGQALLDHGAVQRVVLRSYRPQAPR